MVVDGRDQDPLGGVLVTPDPAHQVVGQQPSVVDVNIRADQSLSLSLSGKAERSMTRSELSAAILDAQQESGTAGVDCRRQKRQVRGCPQHHG